MPKAQNQVPPAHKPAGPLRATAAAIGVGLAWSALHIPANIQDARLATQVEVGIEAVTAILVALSLIKIAVAAITCASRLVGPLLAKVKRS